MKSRQSGFTLVEIAIVLVIIGLLLGGILKGQELINSARVKNLANDFRVIPTYIYAYQDKFRALPGDDAAASTHLAGPPVAANASTPGTLGNGVIEGFWDSATQTDESYLFWQHVRLANLAAGSTTPGDPTFPPINAIGGRLGVTSAITGQTIGGIQGTYIVCSGGILGRFAKQLDIQMDDGQTDTGSMRVVADGTHNGGTALTTANVQDATNYTVCMGF